MDGSRPWLAGMLGLALVCMAPISATAETLATETAVINSSDALEAREIVRRADEQMRGKSSYVVATMNIVRPAWTRSIDRKSVV